MIVIAFFISALLGILIFPMLVPYLLLIYMLLDGIANRQFINELKLSVGGVNIYFPDLLYAASLFLAIFGIMRLLITGRMQRFAPLTKVVVLLIVFYFMIFLLKVINSYFGGVPKDSLVRDFSGNTQCLYFFIPLFYLNHEGTLKRLIYFVLLLSLLFPLIQPFLYGSSDQELLAKGQGTLRLGFGNANLLLMLGILALFVWERKVWLSGLPLAGIAMLAQRSAFISIILCIIVLSFQKKKSMKFITLIGVAGILLISVLLVIQKTSSVPVAGSAAERFSETFEKTGTTEARMLVIPMAFEEFGKRPWLGFTYREIYMLKQREGTNIFSFNMLHPHNFVLESLLRSGIIGTLLLFSIIGVIMKSALRLLKQPDTKLQGMYLFSTILFFVTFGLMNTSFFSAGYVFWILSGISFWYINQSHILKYQRGRTKL